MEYLNKLMENRVMKILGCRNQKGFDSELVLVAANTKGGAYLFNKWFEEKHLSTGLTEPQVIIENHYSE